jgi:outer membrane cobalamin receptor
MKCSFMLILLTFSTSLFAQLSTGKIEGTVRDKDTGSPLQGAQVTVEGTRLGNVTNADGYYFILNVPPGHRDITFTFTGYQKTTVTSQMILAGQTTTIDGALSSTVVQLEGITVEGESEVLMPRDNTASKRRMTSEYIEEAPATKLEDLMVLEAGVQIGGGGGKAQGLRIRGGRLGEELMVVDGMAVRNNTADPFDHTWSGGDWWHSAEDENEALTSQDTNPLEFSTNSVEEVDIITGGFQAEYGNAQSGIVNIVTREGGPKVRGSIKYTTDQQNPRTSDYGYNQLTASIGGPIPIVNNLFFHISGEIQGTADNYPTHADEGFRGVNQDFVDRLNASVVNDPILSLSENAFSLEEFEIGREFYASKTGESASLWTPLNPVRRSENWGDRTMGAGKLTYAPFSSVKFIGTHNISRNQRAYPAGPASAGGNYFLDGWVTKSELPNRDWGSDTMAFIPQFRARRIKTYNTLFGFDWDFLQSATRSATAHFRYTNFMNTSVNGSNLEVNFSRNSYMSWSPEDIKFEVENYPDRWVQMTTEAKKEYYPDGITRWYQGWFFETPFRKFEENLYLLQYRYGREKQHNMKLDVDFQINRRNRAKIGVQYSMLDNHKINPGNWNGPRVYDYEFNYTPRIMAFYLQNRTDLGDFVFDYGMRFDSFRPRENWGLSQTNRSGEGTFPRIQSEWSPRFDVAFPVTDKSQLRFSYGAFTQVPNMSVMYSGTNDGLLDLTRTDAFEAGLSYLASNDVVLDFVAYYRDIEGNISRKEVFRDHWFYFTERRVRGWYSPYTNRDAGNIKGMDLILKKRFSNNFSFDGIYTLQFSRTTGSAPNQALSNAFSYDPATGEAQVPPDDLRPIEGDRTHMFSTRANYLFPRDFKAGTMANKVLGNLRLYGIFTLQSGEPSGGTKMFRGRWNYNLDLRLTKTFSMGGARRLSVFTEIYNVTNRKIQAGYPTSYRYETYQYGHAPVEGWQWDVPGRNQIENVRFNADFNGDGLLSRLEATKGEIAYQMMNNTMNAAQWGIARQIRFGTEIRF